MTVLAQTTLPLEAQAAELRIKITALRSCNGQNKNGFKIQIRTAELEEVERRLRERQGMELFADAARPAADPQFEISRSQISKEGVS